jgi:hypothetical protein
MSYPVREAFFIHTVSLSVVLPDAKWFSREEIIAVLTHPDGTHLTRRDNNRLNAISEGKAEKEALKC